MKVLITGGAGFIGSALADQLLGRGDEVLVIDNYATGRRDNLVPRDGLTVVEGSIDEAALVKSTKAVLKWPFVGLRRPVVSARDRRFVMSRCPSMASGTEPSRTC